MGFAARWGYSSMCMINLFAFRTTKPAELKTAIDPNRSDNNEFVRKLAGKAGLVVSCWGNHGVLLARLWRWAGYWERPNASVPRRAGIRGTRFTFSLQRKAHPV